MESILERSVGRQFATYAEAVGSLPAGGEWSASFGVYSEDGCVVMFRGEGRRWELSRGKGSLLGWVVTEI